MKFLYKLKKKTNTVDSKENKNKTYLPKKKK